MAFEIVLGPEQALAACLALAAGDGAERVEPARDCAEKALFGLHIGRDRPKQRRLRLVGAVGAAKALDRRIGLPSGFQEIVDAQPPIPRRELGVIAAAGAARVREDQDALHVVHEGAGLAEVGGARTVLDHQAVALANDAARASGDLRHHVGSEPLDDLIEGTGHRRERQHTRFPVHGTRVQRGSSRRVQLHKARQRREGPQSSEETHPGSFHSERPVV